MVYSLRQSSFGEMVLDDVAQGQGKDCEGRDSVGVGSPDANV